MEQEKTLVQENKMGVMNENKLLITMALPLIISMLVQACYNIVDSIFVAMVSDRPGRGHRRGHQRYLV